MTYFPHQKDLIWLNFDPSKGREIRKRRPALILSSDAYIRATNFIIVSPITSTRRDFPTFFDLDQKYQIQGQVVCQQLYSYDFSKKAGRQIEYIEQMADEDFYQIAQIVNMEFDFQL